MMHVPISDSDKILIVSFIKETFRKMAKVSSIKERAGREIGFQR